MDLYALVVSEKALLTKVGKPYWTNVLKTKNGSVKSIIWNSPIDSESNPAVPHSGDILHITNFEDHRAERGSVVIKEFNRIVKTALPDSEKSICEVPKASPELMKASLDSLTDDSIWEDKNHYKFTMACLSKFDVEKIRACPAATHVHHSYQGGLVVHTAEVKDICLAVANACERYGFINKDVLLCGAILHDLGKVETYYINDIGIAEKLPTEKTIGHLFYGMHVVLGVFKEGKHKVNKEFVDEVLHLIASHHGDPQWGSIKPVQSLEAGILSRADYISSRNGMVESALKENMGPLTDELKVYGETYPVSLGMKKYVLDHKG